MSRSESSPLHPILLAQAALRRAIRAVGMLLAFAVAVPAPAHAAGELPPAVREALRRAEVPETALTGIVMPADGSRFGWRWEREADRPVQPGSTIKLLTTLVALEVLGPNHRGRTQLLSDARVHGEVLQGDLVLRGGADPELAWPQLWLLLADLRGQGVRRIAGDVRLDRSLFQPMRLDVGLTPFDESPEAAYNGIPDALMFDGLLTWLELRDTPDGVRVRTLPAIDGVELVADLERIDAPCNAAPGSWRAAPVEDDGTRLRVRLQGHFPRGCVQRTGLQLIDRDRLLELAVRQIWHQLGGAIDGRVRPGEAGPGATVRAERVARPWGEVLRPMNKQSDNPLARLLYLQLGAVGPDAATAAPVGTFGVPPALAAGSGAAQAIGRAGPAADSPAVSTLDRAAHAVIRWLSDRGIDDRGLVLDNGSGLSRSERLPPRLLARAIAAGLAGRHAPELLMSLPVAGVDGTLRRRLTDSPAAGGSRLKTGTLRDVAGLAGVVRDTAGRSWIVVVLLNHPRAAEARPALDALVDWVARRPTASANLPAEAMVP